VKTPIETEIKLRVESIPKARALLRRHGFTVIVPRVFEQNLVLDDNQGSLRERGLLLRVRGAGKITTCTFKGPEAKGPETPGRHKRREEREFRAAGLESCVAFFAALGFHEAFRYEKYRTEFARDREPGHVTLDETPIGAFMELEGPARWIDRTAKLLGFPREAYITLSYGRLYEEWCRANGIQPKDMRFGRKTAWDRSSFLSGLSSSS
jgi:adenylate cyclase class 2